MQRVLVLSSYVASGTVGLQATLPALPRATIEAIAVPTVVLSNHPGFKACAGAAIAPSTLESIIDALEANGWLSSLGAIFTGYLPTADHVCWAARAIDRVKHANNNALSIADPVLGDDPTGLYVGRDVADAIRDQILPRADLTTPNRFELAWLSGIAVTDRTTATAAARNLAPPTVAATSIPAGDAQVSNLIVTKDACWTETVALQPHAPHGTGDYFAGLLLAHQLAHIDTATSLRAATEAVSRAIAQSGNGPHLVFS